MSDDVIAVVTVITTAFANGPTLPRESLVYEDTWETDDLIRDLAAVGDRPDQRFIEQLSPAERSAISQYLHHMQVQLADQLYGQYLARAISVWGCG